MKRLYTIAVMGLMLLGISNEVSGQADVRTAEREIWLGLDIGLAHVVSRDQLLSPMAYRANSPSFAIHFDIRGPSTEHSLILQVEVYKRMTNRLTENTALGVYGMLRYDFSHAVASWLEKGRTYIGPSLAVGSYVRGHNAYDGPWKWYSGYFALGSLGVNAKSCYWLHNSSSISHQFFISLFSFYVTPEQSLQGYPATTGAFVDQVVWLSNRFEYRFRPWDSLSLALGYDFHLIRYRYAYGAIAAMDRLSLTMDYHF